MSESHVLFQNSVPYDVPSSLAALHGPSSGLMTLPLHVVWGPARTFDLSDRVDVLASYRAVVREGRSVDHEALLDRGLLIDVWRELRLPERCRIAWEDAFPELRG